jgi:membrane protease YdiL (CAAX protease family)
VSQQRTTFSLTLLAVVLLALAPFPGRWAVLKDLLPILVITWFYRREGYSRRRAGLARPTEGWPRCIGYALLLAVGLYALEVVTTKPLARMLFDQPKDLSVFEPLKGSLSLLLLYLATMWLLAGFGEEYVWRGFVLREIGDRATRFKHPWILAVVTSSVLFGSIHAFQGPRGVFETTAGGLLLGIVYVLSGRSSIWLVVLIHGFQNTISFVAIYFDVYYRINFLS